MPKAGGARRPRCAASRKGAALGGQVALVRTSCSLISADARSGVWGRDPLCRVSGSVCGEGMGGKEGKGWWSFVRRVWREGEEVNNYSRGRIDRSILSQGSLSTGQWVVLSAAAQCCGWPCRLPSFRRQLTTRGMVGKRSLSWGGRGRCFGLSATQWPPAALASPSPARGASTGPQGPIPITPFAGARYRATLGTVHTHSLTRPLPSHPSIPRYLRTLCAWGRPKTG